MLHGLPSNTDVRSPNTPKSLPSTVTRPLPDINTMQVSRLVSNPLAILPGANFHTSWPTYFHLADFGVTSITLPVFFLALTSSFGINGLPPAHHSIASPARHISRP